MKENVLSKKKILVFIISLLFLVGFLPIAGLANPIIHIEDPGLEEAVREKLDRPRGPVYQADLTTITELDASGRGITSLKGLEHFTKLVDLNLEDNKVADLTPLSKLGMLKNLNLRNNGIISLESINFQSITHLPLRKINLSHNVKRMNNVETTRLSDISLLKKLTSLEELELRDNHIEDLTPLSGLTSLKVLDLRENKFKEVEAIKDLKELEELNLRDNDIQSIQPLSDLINLRYLNIHSNDKIQSIEPLKHLVNLETLIMRNVPAEKQVHVFDNLTKLQRLNAIGCGFENMRTDVFSNLRRLGALRGEVQPITLLYAVGPPTFSHIGGFYNKGFTLELHSEVEDGRIYYTLDGSDPNEDSYQYFEKEKIIIDNQDNAIVVRAKVITDDDQKSETITHTYFVNQDIQERFTLPVISLVTDASNLFDEDTGIYTEENASMVGIDWERPIHIEFFEKDGSKGFGQNAGVRIHGGISRNRDQKSLRLYADSKYDSLDFFSYEIFKGLKKKNTSETKDQFKRLLLRNSGNDWNYTMFRDALMQQLVEPLGTMDTQAYRPSIVFINGKYWGIYNIRERYDDYYLAHTYDVPRDKVVILEDDGLVVEGRTSDGIHYEQMLEYIEQNGLRKNSNYEYIQTMMDIENYRDYYIAQTYFGNTDWPHGNILYWRHKADEYIESAPYGHDGRWRWMLFDTDHGFGIFSKSEDRYGGKHDFSHNTINWVMTELDGRSGKSTWPNFLIRSLMENETFRTDFLNRYNDLLNSYFLPGVVIDQIDEMQSIVEHEMPNHIKRWGAISSMEKWCSNVDVLREFALKRPEYIRRYLMEEFDLSGVAELTIETDASMGYVQVNTLEIKDGLPGVGNPDRWSGVYFRDVPITMKAIAHPGFEFSHWEGLEEDSLDESVRFAPRWDMRIKAVFRKKV